MCSSCKPFDHCWPKLGCWISTSCGQFSSCWRVLGRILPRFCPFNAPSIRICKSQIYSSRIWCETQIKVQMLSVFLPVCVTDHSNSGVNGYSFLTCQFSQCMFMPCISSMSLIQWLQLHRFAYGLAKLFVENTAQKYPFLQSYPRWRVLISHSVLQVCMYKLKIFPFRSFYNST